MFDALLAVLVRAQVEFLVVGGVAVAQAGFARFTEDIDLLVDGSPENVRRLIGALSTYGDGAAAELTPDDFPDEEGAVRLVDDVVVDLFTRMSGRTYADLASSTVVSDRSGARVLYLDADGLIALKSQSLRPKDRLDAEALRAILRGETL